MIGLLPLEKEEKVGRMLVHTLRAHPQQLAPPANFLLPICSDCPSHVPGDYLAPDYPSLTQCKDKIKQNAHLVPKICPRGAQQLAH